MVFPRVKSESLNNNLFPIGDVIINDTAGAKILALLLPEGKVRFGEDANVCCEIDPTLPEEGYTLTLREGKDVAILSAGGILTQTLGAADLLAEKGVSAEVVSFPCIKPIDGEKIVELAGRFRHIVTVEEHSVVGGFGSAVAEVLAENGAACKLHRIGMPDVYSCIVGTQQYLRGEYDMDDKAIARRTLAWLEK